MEVEYKWLVLDQALGSIEFVSSWDRRPTIKYRDGWKYYRYICYGLFRFPVGTVYPSTNQNSPHFLFSNLLKWVHENCVPAQESMSPESWRRLVENTAYFLWLDSGQPNDMHEDHWKQAERSLQHLLQPRYPVVEVDDPCNSVIGQENVT